MNRGELAFPTTFNKLVDKKSVFLSSIISPSLISSFESTKTSFELVGKLPSVSSNLFTSLLIEYTLKTLSALFEFTITSLEPPLAYTKPAKAGFLALLLAPILKKLYKPT